MPRGDSIRELDEQMAALVRRAVDDLRVQMRSRLEEATAELQQRLGEAVPELPESFISDEHIQRIAAEVAGPGPEAVEEARAAGEAAGRADAHSALRAALADLDRARSQADVLGALLSATGAYAQRAAILLLRDGQLGGWGARGFESDDDAVRAVSLGGDQDPWSDLASGGPARALPSASSAGLVSQLDSPLADEAYAVPMVLRDRVAAVVYVDRADGSGALDVDAVQVLTYAAALALETLAFREREQTATLRPAGRPEEGDDASPAQAATAAATAAAATEAASPLEPAEPETDWAPPPPPVAEAPAEDDDLDLEAPDEDGPVVLEDDPEAYELSADPELEAVPEFELEDAVLEDAEIDGAPELEASEPAVEAPTEIEIDELPPEEALAFQDEPGEIPTRTYDYPREVEDDDEEPPAVEVEAVEEEPVADEAPPPSAATVAWSPQAVPDMEDEAEDEESEADEADDDDDAGAAEAVDLDERPEAGAVPPPAPTPPSAAGPVEPPADVEGPGFAFSSTTKAPVSEDEEAAHEEARRLARLLVSEIQLYNQDEVEEGRRNRDIYERLRDDIDRSRQLYEERVEPGVRESTDYFYQELVRQLAAGDAKALGI